MCLNTYVYILNFDKQNQTFEFNNSLLETLDYKNRNSNLNFRKIAKNFIFTESQNKSNYYIFKSFIDPQLAKKLKNYYTKTEMKDSFFERMGIINNNSIIRDN